MLRSIKQEILHSKMSEEEEKDDKEEESFYDPHKSPILEFNKLCFPCFNLKPTLQADVDCMSNISLVKISDKDQYTFEWNFIDSEESNKKIYEKIQKKIHESTNACSIEEIKKFVDDNKTKISTILTFYKGDVTTYQLKSFHASHQDKKHVIMNASQTNFLEQNNIRHNPFTDLNGFLEDTTFGPGVVKYYKYGPEFLVSTLRQFYTNIYGATQAFFNEDEEHKKCLQISGGYYTSNVDNEAQIKLANAFQQSDTRVCGFRWHPPKATRNYETYVYQTGAINSKSQNTMYAGLHKNCGPTEEFEFGVLFTQFYNALFTEATESVVFHTTKLGEGVFGNTPNISLYALVAAYEVLPEDRKTYIKSISLGGFSDTDIESLQHFFPDVTNDNGDQKAQSDPSSNNNNKGEEEKEEEKKDTEHDKSRSSKRNSSGSRRNSSGGGAVVGLIALVAAIALLKQFGNKRRNKPRKSYGGRPRTRRADK